MRPAKDTHSTEDLPGERIAKTIARSGLCSRRDAERLIAEGRVSLNGKRLDSPAINVKPADTILVDGAALPAIEPPRLWRYHKPKGRVTTHRDPQGRPTVFEALPQEMPRVISIGRLDYNTEGLLLLTNDGELARHLESPSTGWVRRYRVRAQGKVEQPALDALKDGIEIEGIRYGPIEARLDRLQGTNSWFTVAIREGKNREVRKIMEHLGLVVNRLIRVSFGPFVLGELGTGAIEEVKRRVLAEQLGEKMTAALGLKDQARQAPRPAGRVKPPAEAKAMPGAPKPGGRSKPQAGTKTRPSMAKPAARSSRRRSG